MPSRVSFRNKNRTGIVNPGPVLIVVSDAYNRESGNRESHSINARRHTRRTHVSSRLYLEVIDSSSSYNQV
jgi:hypothetical protein